MHRENISWVGSLLTPAPTIDPSRSLKSPLCHKEPAKEIPQHTYCDSKAPSGQVCQQCESKELGNYRYRNLLTSRPAEHDLVPGSSFISNVLPFPANSLLSIIVVLTREGVEVFYLKSPPSSSNANKNRNKIFGDVQQLVAGSKIALCWSSQCQALTLTLTGIREFVTFNSIRWA